MNSPKGVAYHVFEHTVTFESERRNCKVCGERLRRGEHGLGIVLNCPQTVEFSSPGNFFLHEKCVRGRVGEGVDAVIEEFRFLSAVKKVYGKKWRVSIDDYIDV